MKNIVLSGPSSCGKTSLLLRLQEHGYTAVPESASSVIIRNKKFGGPLFDTDPVAFQQDIFQLAYANEEYHLKYRPHGRAMFLDRALPDVLAYMRYLKVPVTNKHRIDIPLNRYNICFLLEPLSSDEDNGIRWKEDHSKILELLREEYAAIECPTILVPDMGLEERVQFIIDIVEGNHND